MNDEGSDGNDQIRGYNLFCQQKVNSVAYLHTKKKIINIKINSFF